MRLYACFIHTSKQSFICLAIASLIFVAGCSEKEPVELLDLSIEPSLARADTILNLELLASHELVEVPTVNVGNREATADGSIESSGNSVIYIYTYTVTGDEPEGEVPIIAIAHDAAGTEVRLERSVRFDFTPPAVTDLVGPSPVQDIYSDAVFTFGCSEEICEFTCALQGAARGTIIEESICESGVSYSDLIEDEYTFSVQAVDAAGNVGEPAVWTWTVASPSAVVLVVSAVPSPITAGVPASIAIEALDDHGNRAAAYRGTVELSSSDEAAELLSSYTFTAEDEGLVTLSEAVVFKSAGTHSLTVTDTVVSSITGTLEGIDVQPADAALFVLSGIPSSITAGVPAPLTIEVLDAFGNRATAYTGRVGFVSSDDASELPGDYTFVSEDEGIVAMLDAVVLRTAGTHSVTVMDNLDPSITGSIEDINVQSAGANAFVLSGIPSSIMAGVPISLTIEVLDAFGNRVTGYVGTMGLTSSDDASELPDDYTFAAEDEGIVTMSDAVVLKSAGAHSVTVTDNLDPSITGSIEDIDVQPADADGFVLSGIPSSITAGVPVSLTIEVLDAFGNRVTAYAGRVEFSSSDQDAELMSSYAFTAEDEGVVTIVDAIVLKTAGAHSVTVTDMLVPSMTGTRKDIVVDPADADALLLTGIPSPITAGVPTSLTIEVLDAFGNRATDYAGQLTFTSSDDASELPDDYTFSVEDEGIVTILEAVVLKTAGTHSVTVTDTQIPSMTTSVEGVYVQPAAADAFVLTGIPSSMTAGVPAPLMIEVLDAYGNRATAYAGRVEFGSSDQAAELPGDYTFAAEDEGVVTMAEAVVFRTTGTHLVTVTDCEASLTGSLEGIEVYPAAAHQLVFVVEPSNSLVGMPIEPAVILEVQDSFGNFVPDATGSVILKLRPEDSGAVLQGGEGSIVDGLVEFSQLTVDTIGTGYWLKAEAEGLFWPESATFDVALVPMLDLVFPGGTWQDSDYDIDIEIVGEGFSDGARVVWDVGGDDLELTPDAIHPGLLELTLPAHLFEDDDQVVPIAVRHAGVTTEVFDFRFGAVLPDTGQIDCYDNDELLVGCPVHGQDFFGQDAQYGWDLEVSEQERLARHTSYSTEPVVFDHFTQLEWQGCSGGFYGSDCQAGSQGTFDTYTKALEYCNTLSWGGLQGWRLPSAHELFTIVSAGRTSPSTYTSAFLGFGGDLYWTSSTWSDSVLFLMFQDGRSDVGSLSLHYFLAHVRCVRGQPLSPPDFRRCTDEADKPVVRDLQAGLMWQGCSAGQTGIDCSAGEETTKNWHDALSYCSGLQWGGYDDWRLPDRNELQSKLDYSGSWPSHIDPEEFPATPSAGYWSSSTAPHDTTRAWEINFGNGRTVARAKTSSLHVRCVRGGVSVLSHF